MASSVPLLTEFDCIDKNSNHNKHQHLKTMAFLLVKFPFFSVMHQPKLVY